MNALIVFSALVAASSAQLITPYAGLPLNTYNGGYLPYAYNAAPIVAAAPAPAPIAPVSSQYQAQDEFGNVNYGYSNINSAKQEVGNAYGGVAGSYSYIDANGIPQRVEYVADAAGFRVKATNLPVAPVADLKQPVFTGEAPAPVVDTPEVAKAKAEFLKVYEAEKSRAKRSIIAPATYATTLGYPYAYNYGYPYTYGLNYAAPLATAAYAAPLAAPATYAAPLAAPAAVVASAPAAREAVLTTIKLNPGHAEAYIVN